MTSTVPDSTSQTTGARHWPMYIGGQWEQGEATRDVTSPATEEVIATVPEATVDDLDRAVAAALKADREGVWRNKTPDERADILQKTFEILSEKSGELVKLVASENGASVRQAEAFHIGVALGSLEYSAANARTYEWEKKLEPTQSPLPAQGFIRREPVGVVGAILPFNFPLVLGVWKFGPALAAGNTMVVKPDEGTPLTILEFAKAAEQAGLPAGVFNVVTGDGEQLGDRLSKHPDVRKIAFTGSTAVGSQVMKNAADNIKKVTLELGGKGPSVILDDANLDIAVPGSLFAFLMYNGQVCESGTRILVPRAQQDEIVAKMVDKLGTLKVGDPQDPATDFGPVINDETVQRVNRMVAEAVEAGATIAYQGTIPDEPQFAKGHWVAPVLLTNVTNDMEIARTEIFGPVGVVIAYDSIDEAVEIANDTEYGLAGGVWGGDEKRALEVAARLENGTVWVNDWHMFPLVGPFGGYKQSGNGRELGAHAFDEYTEEKYVHLAADQNPQARAYGLLFGH